MRKRRLLILVLSAVALVVCVAVALVWPHPKPLYKVTVLPTLGGESTTPHAINDHGQVVGWARGPGITGLRLFLWERTHGMQDLMPIMGCQLDINNAGQIAGTLVDPNMTACAFLRELDGTVRLLGTLGGPSSEARALNDSGTVVGISQTAAGLRHSFIWDAQNGMRDLGTLGGDECVAYGLNDRGQAFGWSHTRGKQRLRFFLWDPNQGMSQVGPSHGGGNLAGLNNGSWLVGDMYRDGESYVALWRGSPEGQKLFALQGELADPAVGSAHRILLNDANQVAFSLWDDQLWRLRRRITGDPPRLSFLWDPQRGRIALDDHIPRGAWESFRLQDLNNNGCILGAFGSRRGPRCRAVLLEPIPERWGR